VRDVLERVELWNRSYRAALPSAISRS
jgi:hypothetical protein